MMLNPIYYAANLRRTVFSTEAPRLCFLTCLIVLQCGTGCAASPQVNVPDSVASTATEMKPYTDIISGNGVKFQMVPIPAGKFTMGSPDSDRGHKPDESPQHEVEIEPLWIGKYEVTWDEYEIFMATLDIEAQK